MKQKSVQIQIAERAGVSQTLVSFVINDNKKQLARMNDETIARVRQAAEELGYHRNELFAAMRRGHSRFLALMARDVSQEYFARAIEKIMDATEQHDYSQKLFKLKDQSGIPAAVTRIQEYRIQGGVFFSLDREVAKKFWTDLATPSFNALLINCDPKSIAGGVPVQVDEKTAMQNAIRYLLDLGHRRIAYAGPIDKGFAHAARVTAFEAAMKRGGLLPTVIPISWDISDQCETFVSLFKKTKHPTAFICYSDMAAMIIYHAAWFIGLQIPKDLSIIGFDDNSYSSLMTPPLTTFRQDLSVIRDDYVPELIQSIETGIPMNRRKKRLIPVELIERASTGPVQK
jgi:DNA-binding LacI/PurR family transcriptional regulator